MGKFKSVLFFIFLFLVSSNAFAFTKSSQSDSAVLQQFGQLPLRFEQNQGQTDKAVKFLVRGKEYTLFFTETEMVMALNHSGNKQDVLRINLKDANNDGGVHPLETLAAKSNYYLGNDASKWLTDVANHERVQYKAVYPGIDLVFYGNGRSLEYDFRVAPGADPNQIIITFDGTKEVKINETGDVVLITEGGEVKMKAPYVFQEVDGNKKEIKGEFVLNKEQEVQFKLAKYDQEKELVIDPILDYSTYLGGSNGNDQANGVIVDPSGQAYVTGVARASNFPGVSGEDTTHNGGNDVFVAKFNNDGSGLLFSSFLGGTTVTDNEEGIDISLFNSSGVFITGNTDSTTFPTTTNALQSTNAGGVDGFIAKFTSTGSLDYSTYHGGEDDDYPTAITMDNLGNAYVAGHTVSDSFPTTTGAYQETKFSNGGLADGFVSKMTTSGTQGVLSYSTYIGASDAVFLTGVAYDGTDIYVAGHTDASDYPTTLSAYQLSTQGGVDGVVTRLTTSGTTLVYSSYLGGSDDDEINDLDLDNQDRIIVAGSTSSTDFPTEDPAFSTNAGGSDAFLSRFTTTGTGLEFSTYLGGSSSDVAHTVVSRGADDTIFVAGQTASTNFPLASEIEDTRGGLNADAFVTRFDNSDSVAYSTYLGGSSVTEDNVATSVAVTTDALVVFVVGKTGSDQFPTTTGAYQTTISGTMTDAFVTKIDDADPPSPPDAVNDAAAVNANSGANTINVLVNDTTTTGTLSITQVTQGSDGSVAITGGSTSVTYTPDPFFVGADSFTYTITNGSGNDTATVSVTVNGTTDAVNDVATVDQDSGANTIDVLDNDITSTGTISITSVTQGSDGTVTNLGTEVTYEPDAGFSGSDSFTYTISDGGTGSDTATVNVTILSVGGTVDAVDDPFNVDLDSGPNTINVLSNDTTSSGTISITSVTQGSNGTVTIAGTAVTYEPDEDFVGSDSFTYTITNGSQNDTATVTGTIRAACNGVAATYMGTSGNDSFTGTGAVDVIVGLGGNDTLTGRGGNDIICGGSGIDNITGSNGNDTIFGGSGDDLLKGNNGNDTIYGGDDIDDIRGGGATDTLYGGDGNDKINGGNGANDQLFGEEGNDQLKGGGGAGDVCDGGPGTDTQFGGTTCETVISIP